MNVYCINLENKFGKIYTSDERGIIYSISLDHHVYDKNGGVTDFYKVSFYLLKRRNYVKINFLQFM